MDTLVARLFLADNGRSFAFDPAKTVLMLLFATRTTMSEDTCAEWFRSRSVNAGS